LLIGGTPADPPAHGTLIANPESHAAMISARLAGLIRKGTVWAVAVERAALRR
jgi:hypothetical protein